MARKSRLELATEFIISMSLVAGGIYTASLGMQMAPVAGLGGAAMVNAKWGQIAAYFAQNERPPPPYQAEWDQQQSDQNQQYNQQRNRRDD